jgi:cytochrome c oxidase assembly protein subunit 15
MGILQIVVGVAQARLGVPALLVGIHMLLACGVVACVTTLVLALQGTEAPAGR